MDNFEMLVKHEAGISELTNEIRNLEKRLKFQSERTTKLRSSFRRNSFLTGLSIVGLGLVSCITIRELTKAELKINELEENKKSGIAFYNNNPYEKYINTPPKPIRTTYTTDYSQIRYKTREKAEEVLQTIQQNIKTSGRYSLVDFYLASGYEVPDWTYGSYGWEDLEKVREAYVEIDSGLFKITNLPKPNYIKFHIPKAEE